MKFLYSLILAALTLPAAAQSKTLDSELARLNTRTAIIVHSQAIDDSPLWAPGSDAIACNIAGKWVTFDLSDIELVPAKWRKQDVGILETEKTYTPLDSAARAGYQQATVIADAREITTGNGTRVELRETGDFTISLIITRDGKRSETVWISSGENCHTLAVSPNEKYVAYLCETTGLMVMKITDDK